MKMYVRMVFRLKASGMSLEKAISEVVSGYCLKNNEVEQLKALTEPIEF